MKTATAAKKYTGEWVLTDPDCQQYGRQIMKRLFEFKEMRTSGPGEKLKLYQSGIDLSGYTNGKIEWVINSYGYTIFHKEHPTLQYIFTLYGENANWIIAECMFEMQTL